MVVPGDVIGDVAVILFLHAAHGPADDLPSRGRVGLHDLEFLRGEAPGLIQDAVGDLDLPDVVHGGGQHHVVAVFPGQPGIGLLGGHQLDQLSN